ncbi:MAG: HAD-IA family hydrolase [Clostridia bacterium]|nr:HAD-IA family hydrolase [Clostridia bacterium]
MKYKYVLFDMDGTLLNTLDDLTDSCNAAMKYMGFKEHTPDEVKSFINNGARRLVTAAVPEGTDEAAIDKTLEFFVRHYRSNVANKTKPYPGITQLLAAIKARGMRMAVVSNKFDTAVKYLNEKFFSGLIDVAVGERESEGIRKKPHPDTVFEALRLLDAKACDCLYSGDSDVDIQTSKNAGVDCLAVSWGFRSRESLEAAGARFIADSPEDFLNVMDKM